MQSFFGLLVPFLGTSFGAACVFFLKSLNHNVEKVLLGFAAGAMLYVAAAELIPESARETSPTFAGATFSAGFTVMMVLDVALG